ncbi:MAG: cytidine deaminase [Clostridiales bacterium]|jgi:cytidine deaminase|nr:cytidine deaminase [Clostridiales bacterium]MDK2932452.1 cytidine deaminase [Clostridiales bacterium]
MMDEKKLIEIASHARINSYSPYSKFRVGAALLTKSGKVFTGCNIENATYGATCCAERTAIYKAISEGEKEFEAIAVQGDNEGFTFPCGICRQVIAEFSPSIKVILSDKEKNIKVYPLSDLLPHAFYKEDLT